jgi:hypothetical protein
MSRAGRNKRTRHGPPFVQLHWFMLDSEAWRELSAHAQAAYIHLARRYTGSNNGLIALSVRELGQRLSCSKDTASRVLIELENSGFIATETIGTFSLKNRKASTYRLTMYRDDRNGHLPTKDFMRITQSDQRDRTVRPEGHAKQNYRSQSDQKDRQSKNGTLHSPTTGTLIESHQREMQPQTMAGVSETQCKRMNDESARAKRALHGAVASERAGSQASKLRRPRENINQFCIDWSMRTHSSGALFKSR